MTKDIHIRKEERENGKIQFEPSIPPNVKPIYQFHDHQNERTVIIGVDILHSTIETLVYDSIRNVPTDIYREFRSDLKLL